MSCYWRYLGERPQRELHYSLSQSAPSAYLNWLSTQGYSEKEALRLKWLSKDMNEHESYMKDFMTVKPNFFIPNVSLAS